MTRVHLNRRLTLEAEMRQPDGAGGFLRVWQALGVLWAEIDAGAGREAAVPERRLPKVPLKITVRAAPFGAADRPVAGQRFRDATRAYRILAVAERDRRGLYLTCHAEEEAAA
jgi:head-tail adaptor